MILGKKPFVARAQAFGKNMDTPVRCLEFNTPTASKMYVGRVIPRGRTYQAPNEEAARYKCPMTPEVNGLTNTENTMLPMWGSAGLLRLKYW